MKTVYRISTATQWEKHLRDSVGILFESRELATSKIRDLERLARNDGNPQVLFNLVEFDPIRAAASAMGRLGGSVTSERKAEAVRANGAEPHPKRRGRPKKDSIPQP
jgi:hypothetical protein